MFPFHKIVELGLKPILKVIVPKDSGEIPGECQQKKNFKS